MCLCQGKVDRVGRVIYDGKMFDRHSWVGRDGRVIYDGEVCDRHGKVDRDGRVIYDGKVCETVIVGLPGMVSYL